MTAGCGALALVILVPLLLVVSGIGLPVAFDQGFARDYVPSRQAALGNIATLATYLESCESAGGAQPCYPQADSLAGAAGDESQLVSRESSLFFFPSCLRPSAGQESAALTQMTQSGRGIRDVSPSEKVAVHMLLNDISVQLGLARAAVAAGLKCESS